MTQIERAKASATIIEDQTPISSKTSGINNTAPIWNTRVLNVETMAEIKPLFSAVKNEEVNIFKPEKINEKE